MKKLAVLPLVLFFAFATQAQEKYVEVVVTDTILVEPTQWTMFLSIQKYYDYASPASDTIVNYTQDYPSRTEKKGTSIEQLSTLVKKHGGKLLDDSSGVNYTLSARDVSSTTVETGRTYLNASFSSRKSLESFLKAAKQFPDVEGQITSAINPDLQKFQSVLDTKLMNNAKQKASRLAVLGGNKLGDVISITELTESEMSSLKNFLEKIFKMDKLDRKSDFSEYFVTDKIVIERSLRTRFAIL